MARKLAFLTLLVVLLIVFSGCEQEKEPVKIGFIGTLSGRISDLSIAGRNGALLAIEEFNEAGGLDGRPVELVSRDDGNDEAQARLALRELLEEEVVSVVGPMTSSVAQAVVHIVNREEMLMISPTTSTEWISGQNDYFIRVFPGHMDETEVLAEYVKEELGIEKMGIVYDLTNHTYTIDWYSQFRRNFSELGGMIEGSGSFNSGTQFSYARVLEDALANDPGGIVIIAGSVDAARFAQELRRKDPDIAIFAPAWAKNTELIEHGGSAAEGITGAHAYDPESEEEEYVEFKENYLDRFGQDPGFGSLFSYEAVQVLLWALESTEEWSGDNIRKEILEHGLFPGLQEDFYIDPSGDAHRGTYLWTIDDGVFKRIDW